MKLLLLDLPAELIFAFARGDKMLCSEYIWEEVSLSRATDVLGHILAFNDENYLTLLSEDPNDCTCLPVKSISLFVQFCRCYQSTSA